MDNWIAQFKSYYPGLVYIDDVSTLAHKKSDNLSIICPGIEAANLDFHSLEQESDLMLLSWSNLIDCKATYRWIEPIPHYSYWHEKPSCHIGLYDLAHRENSAKNSANPITLSGLSKWY